MLLIGLLLVAYLFTLCVSALVFRNNVLSVCSRVRLNNIQSTLVISNSKGLSAILRDLNTSTYQICRIEEKLIR